MRRSGFVTHVVGYSGDIGEVTHQLHRQLARDYGRSKKQEARSKKNLDDGLDFTFDLVAMKQEARSKKHLDNGLDFTFDLVAEKFPGFDTEFGELHMGPNFWLPKTSLDST